MIAIKRNTSTLFTTQINKGSKRKFTLQKEDYVNLKFSVETPLYFRLGDHIELDNDPTGLFEIVTPQAPTYNTSTGGYDYDLRFDAYYMKWRNKVMKYTPEIGGQEASFNLTAELAVHLDIVLRNLKALNYTYKGEPFTFSIDDSVAQKAKVVTYNNTNIIDALTLLAQTFECEWWVTNNIIHFGKCEQGDYITFEENVNVEKMTRSDSSTPFATRIYAFGSTRNIPTNYRPVTEQPVVNGIVQKRLMLPKGTPYIDAYEGMTQEEAVEQIVTFEDIYPKRVSEIKEEPTTKQYTDKIEHEDKTTETIKWNAYRLKYEHGDFKRDYILPGKTLRIVFQSGLLNGMEFEVIFSPDTAPKKTTEKTKETTSTEQPRTAKAAPMLKSNNGESEKEDTIHNSTEDPDKEHFHGGMSGGGSGGSGGGTSNDNTGTEETNSTEQQPDVQIFEIVRNEDYGRPLPDDVLKPKKGDKYILFNFDIQHVSDNYITQAEEELKQKAIEHVRKTMIDPSVYQCPMKYESVTSINGNFAPYDIGQRVDLRNKAYFKDGRKSRIIGFEYNLDIPQDHPTYTIGESVAYSRLAEMEGKIDELTYQGQTYNGVGGSGVYLIKSFDRTTATDYNAFSAKRALREFINKANPDTMPYLLTLLQGIKFSNAAKIDGIGNAFLNSIQLLGSERFLNGFGVWLDDNGRAHGQIDFLHVFGKAIFNTVEIRELSHVGGDIGLSKASGKIIKVVKVEKGWKCYLKTDDGTIFTFNGWKCGDQAKCQTFNLRKGITNNAANRYYWRCVEGVAEKTDTEEAYIVLSNVEHFFDPMGTDEPREGDTLVLCGHNRTWDLTHGITESDTSRMNFTQITTSKEEGGTIEVYRNIQDFKMTLGNAIFHLSSEKLYVNTNSLVWLSGGGEQVANMLFRGDWYKGVTAYKNEVWYHTGEGWLSLTDNNTDEPTASSLNWQCRIQKGKDGGTGLRVEGFSSAGSAAYTEGQTSWKATFELHVWENDVEITTSLPSTRFVWERVSEYPEGDIAWNNRHSSDGNKINVTYDDLMGDTSFICKFLSANGKKVITSRTF